jgi:hypothetical protein
MRKCFVALVLLVVALASSPRPASAQIGFESLLKDVNTFSFFFSCWNASGGIATKNSCPSEKNGYGLEVSYVLAKLPVRGGDMVRTKARMQPTGMTVKCTSSGCETDTTFNYVPAKATPTKYVQLELALGYSQFSGFQSTDPTLELRGAVREIPAVAVYGTFVDDNARGILKYIEPYLGVTSGIIQLSNVTLLDRAKVDTLVAFSANGSAFQLGGAGGIQIPMGDRISFFSEISYQIRRFPGVQWGGSGSTKIRSAYPKQLDFTGRALTIGLEFGIHPPAQ